MATAHRQRRVAIARSANPKTCPLLAHFSKIEGASFRPKLHSKRDLSAGSRRGGMHRSFSIRFHDLNHSGRVTGHSPTDANGQKPLALIGSGRAETAGGL
jgi:hypothetical protein